MTLADWFSPRMDGTLHWQQSLAITLGVAILVGPTYFWWRYDHTPKAYAAEEAVRALGADSDFRATRLFNSLNQHHILTMRTRADTLICGTALIDGARAPVAFLADARRRGRLVDRVLFTPEAIEHPLYPDLGPEVLAICAAEAV